MIKKISLAFVAVLFSLAMMTGCSKDKGAEKFVTDYYKAYIDGKMTAEMAYDNYISDVSKDLLKISKENYVETVNKRLATGFKYKSVEVSSVTNYDDSIYKVRCYIEVTQNGQDTKYHSDEYVINENGEYKFLQYGVNSKEAIETSYVSNDMSVAIDNLYIGPDKVMVNLIAKNNTTSNYAVGYNGNGKIVVETDQGSAEQKIDGTNIVKAMSENSGTQEVKNVKGKIKTITIYNIFELNANGEPKNHNNARSFVLYQAPEPLK